MKYIYFYIAFIKFKNLKQFIKDSLLVIYLCLGDFLGKGQITLIKSSQYISACKELRKEYQLKKPLDCVEILWDSEEDENLVLTKQIVKPRFKNTIVVLT